MAFRNPVTTLPSSAIVGDFPANRISDGAFTGVYTMNQISGEFIADNPDLTGYCRLVDGALYFYAGVRTGTIDETKFRGRVINIDRGVSLGASVPEDAAGTLLPNERAFVDCEDLAAQPTGVLTANATRVVLSASKIARLTVEGDKLSVNGKLQAAGTAGQWAAPTFQNGWENYGPGWAQTAYRKLPTNQVQLKGLIKHATTTTTGTCFTLPAGFRPTERYMFVCWSAGGTARIDLLTDGQVFVYFYGNGGNASYVSLDTIRFPAA